VGRGGRGAGGAGAGTARRDEDRDKRRARDEPGQDPRPHGITCPSFVRSKAPAWVV
jgi:hypothetical protein